MFSFLVTSNPYYPCNAAIEHDPRSTRKNWEYVTFMLYTRSNEPTFERKSRDTVRLVLRSFTRQLMLPVPQNLRVNGLAAEFRGNWVGRLVPRKTVKSSYLSRKQSLVLQFFGFSPSSPPPKKIFYSSHAIENSSRRMTRLVYTNATKTL